MSERSEIVCVDCEHRFGMDALDITTCNGCGAVIVSPQTPGYRYCHECAEKLNICQQCGRPLNSRLHQAGT